MANVNVTYDEMNSAAGRLRTGQQTLTDALNDLKRQVDELVSGGFVTDQASGAFQTTYEQFTTASTQAVSAIDGLAGFPESAATPLAEGDSSLAKAIQGRCPRRRLPRAARHPPPLVRPDGTDGAGQTRPP